MRRRRNSVIPAFSLDGFVSSGVARPDACISASLRESAMAFCLESAAGIGSDETACRGSLAAFSNFNRAFFLFSDALATPWKMN